MAYCLLWPFISSIILQIKSKRDDFFAIAVINNSFTLKDWCIAAILHAAQHGLLDNVYIKSNEHMW